MKHNRLLSASPVETRILELPRGDGEWLGFEYVYRKLQEAAEYLGKNDYTRCGDDHANTMAIMGCGHEETMKAHVAHARYRGWIK